ncbi:HAMP domain-containing histidine kinase [bacterium]|nr:HAMP domain-containing histidine kinase [bacterium]
MNPYAIPALIAAVLLYTLELVGWLFRTKERVNVAFALFAGAFGTDALVNFFVLNNWDHPDASQWIPVLIVTTVLALAGTIYFIMVLTGHDTRLNDRFLGIPLKYNLIYLGIAIPGIILYGTFSSNMFESISLTNTGLNVDYGPYGWLLAVVMIPLPLTVWPMLFRAIREADEEADRHFLTLNTIGLAVLILAQPVFELLMVHFSFTGQFLSYVGAAIGAIFFLIAIVHHQFDRIEALNLGLEQKVADRTRHLRDAQARLVQSEKIASLAHLVAGVAHEFNTPLGAVKSSTKTVQVASASLDTLLEQPDSEENRKKAARILKSIQSAVKVVQTGSNRIATMVNRLKSFAHLDEPEIQTFDLHQGLEDSITMLSRGWEDRITIEKQFGELPRILGFPVLVNQVFFNTLTNAIESIKGEGFIRIETGVEDGHAVVRFNDNGSGIAEEHLAHIYDPGFTTKGPGVGMGLGLAIAHNVMEQHQGEIEIHSTRGEGTTLILSFPLDLTPDRLNLGPYSATIQIPHDDNQRDVQE